MFNRPICIKQQDQTDCGAAALATVARHYGRPVKIQALRDLAGTDRQGTNLLGMVEAAEKLNLTARAVKGQPDALPHVPLPAIAHVTNEDGLGHFVVLFKVKKGRVTVADPGKGVVKMTREAFERMWTGYLLLIEPRHHAAHRHESDHDQPAPAWRRLLALVASHRGLMFEAVLCALLMTLLGLCTSVFVQHLVDSVLVHGQTGLLNALGLGMLLVVLFKTLFAALRGYLLAHVGRKIDLALMSAYLTHVVNLPLRFFETRRIGEILSRSSDAAKIREAVSGAALTIALDGLMLVVSMAVLWTYDVPLAALATAFVPVLLVAVLAHHPAARARSQQAMEGSARYSAHAIEDITGVATIKALGVQRQRGAVRDTRLVGVIQSAFGLRVLGVSMNSMSTLITGAAGIAVLWYGGHRTMQGALTVGQLMFFYTMLGHLLGPLERLASVNLQIQDALVAAGRLFEIMDLDTESLADPNQAEFETVREAIRFEGVTFRYGCREQVLRGVDLTIPAGATVGIVGESGSGKSTLLKMLQRFYDADEGRILLDGLDARDIRTDSLRAGIATVGQDPFIFNGTIRENIALGSPDVKMARVAAAATAAGLDGYINNLPERYETIIGERGANLSGGQRQRLAIARALLSDAPILLFDEATSHLDTTTERAIQKNLKTQLKDKTVVAVAHRLSTIKDADVIHVMHEGQVVESGTHDELLTMNGRYASLWRAQTGRDTTHAYNDGVDPRDPHDPADHGFQTPSHRHTPRTDLFHRRLPDRQTA